MDMKRVLVLHMQGSIGIDKVVEAYMACNSKDRSIAAYILHKSIEDVTAEKIEAHSTIVHKMYRSEFVPGLMSKYISIVVGKYEEAVKHKALGIVLYIVQKIHKLCDVEGLEDRMMLLMTHEEVCKRKRGTEEGKVVDEILHVLYTKASKEAKVHIARTVLQREGHASTQGVVYRQSSVDAVRHTVAQEDVQEIVATIAQQSTQSIVQCRDIVQGIASAYGAMYIQPILSKMIEHAKNRDAQHRADVVECIRNIRRVVHARITEQGE